MLINYPGFKKINAIVNYPPKYNQLYPNVSLTAFYMHTRMTIIGLLGFFQSTNCSAHDLTNINPVTFKL